MTADRPWASGPCMAGRPDDCPRVHPVDGRRCINPLHTAYPDDLGAGEQPTLDAPDPIDTCDVETDDPYPTSCDLDRGHNGDHENTLGDTWPNERPTIVERLTDHFDQSLAAAFEGDGDPHDALADAANTVTTRATCGAGCDGVSHGLDCNARTIDGKPPTSTKQPRRRRWTCDRCGELVIRAEHVAGTRKEPAYACDEAATPAEPVHNHEWAPMADPHGIYAGKAYSCGCGASMDDRRVYPFGDTPGMTLADDAVAGGAWTAVPFDQSSGTPEPDDPTGLPPVELTAGEVKRIIGAHTVLRHATALDVVREILDERRIYPNGKP